MADVEYAAKASAKSFIVLVITMAADSNLEMKPQRDGAALDRGSSEVQPQGRTSMVSRILPVIECIACDCISHSLPQALVYR